MENNIGDRFSPCPSPFKQRKYAEETPFCNDFGFNIFVGVLNDSETFSVYMMSLSLLQSLGLQTVSK